MLEKILSQETCKNCKICCSFVQDDVWEAPFGKYNFKNENEILLCPKLVDGSGCTMGDEKPFDCSIWPLRPFKINETLKIGICKICPAFKSDSRNSYEAIIKLLSDGLYDKIKDEVEKRPELIKKYTKDYDILM